MEDGTGEAQLYVYDDIVATVLKLSCQQWRHLQDLAMRTGELMYQRYKWFGGNGRPKVKLTTKKKKKPVKFSLFFCCFFLREQHIVGVVEC